MGDKGKSGWLFGIGAAVSAAVLGIVGWGRARRVDVPQPMRWPAGVVVFGTDEPDLYQPLAEALSMLAKHGHPVQLAPPGEPCDVLVRTDPTLDERDSVADTTFVHGRTTLHSAGEVIIGATIRVVPGSGPLVLAHEAVHALGYQHPVAAPTGHVLHPSRPGLRDWRGL